MKAQYSNIIKATLYFFLSVILTSVFISQKFWLYSSLNAMILSGSIAGIKWLIQIIAALLFLNKRKWEFIRRIGFVCFIGSVVLFVYDIFNFLSLPIGGFSQFVLAVALAVLILIFGYYQAVKKTGLSLKWFWGWILCLSIAIFLQLTFVF
jgi:multisubunit Na+/H+ antiporter MnhB subunit